MADVTNELIYEVLKAMQSRLGNIEFGVQELKTEMSALRGHVIAIQTDINSIHSKIAYNDTRFDRLEKRAELEDLRP